MKDITADEKMITKPAEKKAGRPKGRKAERLEDAPASGPQMAVVTWLARRKIYGPLGAALLRYKRWSADKQLNEQEFDAALAEMRAKPASKV